MPASPAASRLRRRAALDAARRLFESGPTPMVEIGRNLGVSAKVIARCAKKEGWLRPAAPLVSARRLTERLWAVLEQRIALVEKDPGATPARDFVALSHALRDLSALAVARREEAPEQPGGDDDAEALRAELLARLERILPD